MEKNKCKFAALVLAGGQSKRMGKDKVTLSLFGQSFLERGIAFWKQIPKVCAVYVGIGSKEHLEEIKKDKKIAALFSVDGEIPIKAVYDLHPGCGPLAGIQAAFIESDADYLYVSAIDVVNIEKTMVPQPDESDADAYVYRHAERTEPLFALYSRRILPVINEMFDEEIYKMRVLLDRVNTKYLDPGEDRLSIFINCNTPKELEKVRAMKEQKKEEILS